MGKEKRNIYDWLLWVTNNEDKPKKEWAKDEIAFDIFFFISGLLLVVLACILFGVGAYLYLTGHDKEAWCLVFISWACEGSLLQFIILLDWLRHNRSDE